jgi:sulfoxide reductase heme-binding subunit YedZ
MSTLGFDARVLWYLSRGTGMIALMLLTITLVLGVISMTTARWTTMPRYVVAGLHRNVSLLLVAFVAVHVSTSVLDSYAGIRLIDAVLPFGSSYRPVWVGLGAIAFDLLLAVVITSLVRVRLGLRAWRAVHWAVYAIWPVTVLHAFGTGSDVRTGMVPVVAAVATGLVVAAAGWRIITANAPAWVRGACALAGIAVMFSVTAWALNGPLQTGWAHRAANAVRPADGQS